MDLARYFLNHRFHGGVLRPAVASTTAGPGGWWRPTAGRLLTANRLEGVTDNCWAVVTANRLAGVTANRWAVSRGSGQRLLTRPVRDTVPHKEDVPPKRPVFQLHLVLFRMFMSHRDRPHVSAIYTPPLLSVTSARLHHCRVFPCFCWVVLLHFSL